MPMGEAVSEVDMVGYRGGIKNNWGNQHKEKKKKKKPLE
jgi:hypothetical protein